VKDQTSWLEEEAGQAQDQVSRGNTRACKPLQKGKDPEELLVVVRNQDQVPMLQVASQERQVQAKVPSVGEEGEAAKDPKRLAEVKQDEEEDLLPSHKLVTKALASQDLEDQNPVTATVLLVTRLGPLELDPLTLDPARSQVQKNMEPLADLELRVTIGCRDITAGLANLILRPCCLLCQASLTSSLQT